MKVMDKKCKSSIGYQCRNQIDARTNGIIGIKHNFFKCCKNAKFCVISAYSLHAWLSKDITGMYNKNPPGHIRYWDDVYNNFRVT